jgi:hypothetical protein
MSALTFVMSGGMAMVNGDLPKKEQEACGQIVRAFGERIRAGARERGINASALTVFAAQYLFVGEDALGYSIVFATFPGGQATLNYKDLRSVGFVLLDQVKDEIRKDVGDVVYGFYLPKPATAQKNIEAAALYLDQVQGTRKESPLSAPPEIVTAVEKFRKDHPVGRRTAFMIMRFSSTPAHMAIVKTIGDILAEQDIDALRADDKEYADDLFPNVRTYMHCCDFGIGVFERLETNDFNPNVSLEVGYMMALGKPVCLLKDRTLTALQTDLVGKLYKTFDTQTVEKTLPDELRKWLRDRDLLKKK